MKLLQLALVLVFPPVLLSATATLPPELSAARMRYDAALTAATKPVRDKYAAELQQIKNRAMFAKNLELAIAVDAELKALAGPPAPAAAGLARNEATLNDFANHTVKWLGSPWSWELLPELKFRKLKDGVAVATGNYAIEADGRVRLGGTNAENFVPKSGKKGVFYKDSDDKTPKGEVVIESTKKK